MSETISACVKKHLEQYFESLLPNIPNGDLYAKIIKEVEKPIIETTIKISNGNKTRAAEILGLNRNTLRKKIKELGIEDEK